MKKRILFVCKHNSARSQMAEAFLQEFASSKFEVHSAGLEKGNLNPIVVEVMNEIGIDISMKQSNSVTQYLNKKIEFDYVITVCDKASGDKCPLFPGKGKKLHWGFEDPASAEGTYNDKLVSTRIIRDQIKEKIKSEFC